MNTPSSRQGNLTRYAVYLVLYLIVIGVKKLTLLSDRVNKIGYFFFLIFALFTLYFYIRQFNREQRFFEKKPSMPLLADYGFIVGVSILVILGRIFISYLQAKGTVPLMNFQVIYQKGECNLLFWFFIFSIGILIPAMQVYLTTGFFFNYGFRAQNMTSGIDGIICSGFFFGILNFQTSFALFIINSLYGMLLAWSYLYSQRIMMPIYLAILNGIFMVILA